ncbi:MAG: hypothetical protein IT225_09865 [Flavobacteriales bacterium]|nr:hypothetical protein [Flavobacteriales bacterium]
MNADTRNNLLQHIAEFHKLDLAAAFAAWKPEQPDLGAIQLANYSGTTFIQLSHQFTESIEAALGKASWHAIPNVLTGHHEWGQVDMLNMYSNHISHIQSNNIDAAAGNLDRLLWHAMACGYWLDDLRQTPPKAAELNARLDALNAQRKRLDQSLEQFKNLQDELSRSRTSLDEFRNSKVTELEEVRRNMEASRQHVEELQKLLQNGQATETQLKSVQEGLKDSLDKANIELATLAKAYEGFKADSDQQRKSIADQATDTNAALKAADELREWIESRKERIEQLTGMAADGFLGNKYNDRSVRLEPNITFWRWAILAAVIVTVAWVVIVFQWVHTKMDNPWVELSVNLLKTVPAFIMLGFVLRQYSKERDLQEEYAFKSAVAMTINPYADLLNDKDNDANRSRQRLIMNALKQVHTPPHLSSEKGGTLISLNSKDLKESIANLTEAVKSKPE